MRVRKDGDARSVQAHHRVPAEGGSAGGDPETGRGPPGGDQAPGPARRHRQRQDLHHGQGDRGGGAADAGPVAQQDAGGAALQEFRRFFPENAVEYFVSYYDYYQPEAYVPQSDTYIEKEA